MTRKLSVAHLTAIDLPPPDFISLAADVGFDAVGLRLLRVTETTPGYPLFSDAKMMRETKAALDDTGITVHDVEFIKITPEIELDTLNGFLDAAAELHASEMIVSPYDPNLARLADTLGDLSERAQLRGIGVSLEFFPWTVVPNLSVALETITKAGPTVGVLVDSLHFNRSDSSHLQLASAPSDRLRFAHLCDAPVKSSYTEEELLFTAREERLPPGQGQIDLVKFLAALPKDLPLGLEVPMTNDLRTHGAKYVLKNIYESATSLILDLP